jgi:transcriptional regulator with XRE-family HTH domain
MNEMSALAKQSAPTIGSALRERRAYHGWTLADVAERTGISKSTLSKIENNQISPSYQSILQLCAGLGIEIGDLMSADVTRDNAPKVTGRRNISYAHSGLTMGDDLFTYTYLCTDIAHKRIIPMVVEVRAHSVQEVGELWSHVGEEFLYVLDGTIDLHTDLYEPAPLAAGDCVYFDSTMGHAFIATNEAPARLLIMCSSATPNLAQTLREALSARLNARRTGPTRAERDGSPAQPSATSRHKPSRKRT